jgi:hypothetical protein
MNLPLRLISVLVLAGCLLAPWRATRILAVLDVLLLLPAWALAARARVSLVPALGLTAASSPVLFGAVMLLSLFAGAEPGAAAWTSVAVWALVFAVFGGGEVRFNNTELRIARYMMVVAVVAGILAFSLPIWNEWWRVREDSWFHAAVMKHIFRHGVPPNDPYFSPLRLQYMYFYHTIVAGVSSLTGLGAFRAMIVVNGAALTGCVFGFGYFSSFFSRRLWPRTLGLALVLFGMNGLFYVFYPIRIARVLAGETGGLALLRHFFPWSPAGHATAARLLSIEGNQFLFLDKFMLGTALSLTLGLVCVILGLLVSARRGHWTRSHSALFVLALAGVMYLHIVIGVMAVAGALVLLALLVLVRSHTGDGAPSYPSITVLALVAVALAAPFIYAVMPREGGGQAVGFGLQPGYVVGLLSSILPAVILSIPFLRWQGTEDEWRRLGRRDDAVEPAGGGEAPRPPGGVLVGRLFGELSVSGSGIVAMWTLIVLLAALVTDLPTNNETKFSFLLFLPLAGFAVGGIDRLWDTRRGRIVAVAVVVASTAPLNGIYFYHAFGDESTFEIADDEAAAYDFIEGASPVDAVYFDSDDFVRIPVLGSRDLYWGNETYAFNWGYPTAEVRRRREIRDSVFNDALRSEHIHELRSLGRPVYVMVRGAQFDRFPLFQRMNADSLYTGRFIAGEYAVFEMRLDGGPTDAP